MFYNIRSEWHQNYRFYKSSLRWRSIKVALFEYVIITIRKIKTLVYCVSPFPKISFLTERHARIVYSFTWNKINIIERKHFWIQYQCLQAVTKYSEAIKITICEMFFQADPVKFIKSVDRHQNIMIWSWRDRYPLKSTVIQKIEVKVKLAWNNTLRWMHTMV